MKVAVRQGQENYSKPLVRQDKQRHEARGYKESS